MAKKIIFATKKIEIDFKYGKKDISIDTFDYDEFSKALATQGYIVSGNTIGISVTDNSMYVTYSVAQQNKEDKKITDRLERGNRAKVSISEKH